MRALMHVHVHVYVMPYIHVILDTPMGEEAKWLLKEGGGPIQYISTPTI